MQFTDKQIKEIQHLILDLGWDGQRMSSSGLHTYNELCIIFNIEPYEEQD